MTLKVRLDNREMRESSFFGTIRFGGCLLLLILLSSAGNCQNWQLNLESLHGNNTTDIEVLGQAVHPINGTTALFGNDVSGRLYFQFLSFSTSQNDGFIVQLDSAGNRTWQMQARSANGTNTQTIEDAVYGTDGTMFITGTFRGAFQLVSGIPSAGGGIVYSQNGSANNSSDVFLLCISPTGNLNWSILVNNNNDEKNPRLSIDSVGISLAFEYEGKMLVDGYQLPASNASDYDIGLCRIDWAGNVVRSITGGGNGDDQLDDVISDFQHTYISTFIKNPGATWIDANSGFQFANFPSSKTANHHISAFAHDNGRWVWESFIDDDANTRLTPQRLGYGCDGLYAIASIDDGATFSDGSIIGTAGNKGLTVTRYEPVTGQIKWVSTGRASGYLNGKDICFAEDGEIHVIGDVNGAATFPGFNLNTTSDDLFWLRLDQNGSITSLKEIQGTNIARASGIAPTPFGGLVACGSYDDQLSLGSLNLNNPRGPNFSGWWATVYPELQNRVENAALWQGPAEYDASIGPLNLNEFLTPSTSGFADQVVSASAGINNPNSMLSDPGLYSTTFSGLDEAILDLTDTVPAGEMINIHCRHTSTSPSFTLLVLEGSIDGSTFFPIGQNQIWEDDYFVWSTFNPGQNTRFIKIRGSNNSNFRIEAIEYSFGARMGGSWTGPGTQSASGLFDLSGISGPQDFTYTYGIGECAYQQTRTINITSTNTTTQSTLFSDIGSKGAVLDLKIDSIAEVIYAVGWFEGNEPFAGTNASSTDAFIYKGDFFGNTLWLESLGGSGNDQLTGVTIGHDGNIYASGHFEGNFNYGSWSFSSQGDKDALILGFDPSGNPIWHETFGGANGDDLGTAITANQQGIFVHGAYNDGSVLTNVLAGVGVSNNSSNGYVSAFDYSGSNLWTVKLGSTGIDIPSAIASDDNGIVITGFAKEDNLEFTNTSGGSQLLQASTHPENNIYVIAYSNAGVSQWAHFIENDGSDNIAVNDVAIGCNQVYVAGRTHEPTIFPSGETISGNGVHDFVFLAALNQSNGNTAWVQPAFNNQGNNHKNDGMSISLTSNCHVHLTGMFAENIEFDGYGELSENDNKSVVYHTRFNPWGEQDWLYPIHLGTESATPFAFGVSNAGQSFIGGQYASQLFLTSLAMPTADVWPVDRSKWAIQESICAYDGILDLSALLEPVSLEGANAILNSNSVLSEVNSIGKPDGATASFGSDGSFAEYELSDTIEPGTDLLLHARHQGSIGTAIVHGSMNGSTWYPLDSTEILDTIIMIAHVSLDTTALYVRVSRDDVTNPSSFEVDAITFYHGSDLNGTWSGPGVNAGSSSFNPAGLSGPQNINYTVTNSATSYVTSNTINVTEQDVQYRIPWQLCTTQDPLHLDSLLFSFADSLISPSVAGHDNILGLPDGVGGNLHNGNPSVITGMGMSDTLKTNHKLAVRWRRKNGNGTSTIQAGFSLNPGGPFIQATETFSSSSNTIWQLDFFTIPTEAQYVQLTNTSSTIAEVDAIGHYFTDSGNGVWTVNGATTTVLDPGSASYTDSVQVTYTPPTGACIAPLDMYVQLVQPATTGGQIITTQTCQNGTSDTLILTNPAGTVWKWQWSSNNFSSFVDTIQSYGDTLILANINAGDQFRVLVGDRPCGIVISDTLTAVGVDVTAPIFTSIPADTTLYVNTDCNVVYAIPQLSGTDNCDPNPAITTYLKPVDQTLFVEITGQLNLTLSPNSYQLRYDLIDARGNKDRHEILITVTDSIAPVLDCTMITDTVLYLNEDCEVLLPDYSFNNPAIDNCGISGYDQYAPPGLYATSPGLFKFWLAVKDDFGNLDTCYFTVHALDTIAPTFSTLINDTTIAANNFSCQSQYVMPSIVASDNCSSANAIRTNVTPPLGTANSFSGVPTQLTLTLGQNQIDIVFADASGNERIMSWLVSVIDATSPNVACQITQTQIIVNNSTCEGLVPDLSTHVNVTDCSSYSLTQTPAANSVVTTDTIVWLIAQDAANNIDSCSIQLEVELPNEMYFCNDHDTIVQIDANGFAQIPDVTGRAGANGFCQNSNSTQAPVAGTSFSTNTTISVTTTNDAGGSKLCEIDVILQDSISPLLIVHDTTLALNSFGSLSIDSSHVVTSVTDNGGYVTASVSPHSFDCSALGTPQIVVITAQDSSGNDIQASASVTIIDTTPPVFTLPDTIEIYLNAHSCDTILNLVLSANDACDSSPAITHISGVQDGDVLAANTIATPSYLSSYRASDQSGNNTEQEVVVIVYPPPAGFVDYGSTSVCANQNSILPISYGVVHPNARFIGFAGLDIDPITGEINLNNSDTGIHYFGYAIPGNNWNCDGSWWGNIRIEPENNAGIDTTVTVCDDNTIIDLDAFRTENSTEGQWEYPSGSGNIISSLFDLATVSAPSNLSFSYIANASGSCLSSTSELAVNLTNGLSAGVDTSMFICGNQAPFDLDTLLSPSAASGGQWFTASGNPIPNGIVTYPNAYSGNYFYTITNLSASCVLDDSATYNIGIGIVPFHGNIAVTSSDFCVGSSFMIGLSGYNTADLDWAESTDGGQTFQQFANNVDTVVFTILDSGSYIIGIRANLTGNLCSNTEYEYLNFEFTDGVLSTSCPTTTNYTLYTENTSCLAENALASFTDSTSWFTQSCGAAITISQSIASGSYLPVGSHPLVITGSAAGETLSCAATYTVIDTVSPTMNCNDTLVFFSGADPCGIYLPNLVDSLNYSDNCTSTAYLENSFSQTLAVGSFLQAGSIHTLQYSVTDSSGNTAKCNVHINVVAPTPNLTYPATSCATTDSLKPLTFDPPGGYFQLVGFSLPINATNGAVDISNASGNYEVQYILPDPCRDTAFYTFTIVEPINYTDSSVVVCSGTSVSLSAILPTTNPTGGIFTNGLSQVTGNPIITQDTTFYYVHATTSCASDSASLSISVGDTEAPVVTCQSISVYLNNAGTATIANTDLLLSVTDNCVIRDTVVSQYTFTCSEAGTTLPLTITVSDSAGNATSCATQVTVLDTISPVTVCQNITVYLDASGNASITANDIDNGSSDNCGAPTLSIDISTFDCSNLGANTVTLTAADASKSSLCTATVTVLDTISPTAICQSFTVALNGAGIATVTPADVNNNSTDNCSIASQSVTPNTFTSPGTYNVWLVITDQSNNTDSCQALVTVNDNSAPVAVCNDTTLYLDASGNAGINSIDLDGGSTDNGSIVGFLASDTVFDCSNLGSNQVTLTVTDGDNNATNCTANVIVLDTIRPTVVCQNITAYLDASGNATITASDIDNGSADNCGTPTLTIDSGSFDCSMLGANTVILTASDGTNTDSCSATVTVTDTISPTAVCQSFSITLGGSGLASITPADIDNGSSDNCSIVSQSVSPNTFNSPGTYNVWLVITDQANNTDSCQTAVTVNDNTAPVAICKDTILYLDALGNAGINSIDLDGGSTDNGTIVSFLASDTTFDCSELGSNTVTLTVNDENNNATNCTANVTVSDTIKPVALTQDILVYLDATGSATINASAVNNGSSDNCGIPTLSINKNTFNCTDLGAPVSVTLLATDASANSDSMDATVNVLDTISPTVLCRNVTVYLDNNGEATITPAAVDSASSDNCHLASRTLDITSFTCADIGLNTVTLTVVDSSGNSSNNVAFVTIVDSTNSSAGSDYSDTICESASNYELAAGLGTYSAGGSWFVDDGSWTSTNANLTQSEIIPGNFVFAYVTMNTSSCTSDTAFVSLTIQPENQISTSPVQDLEYCSIDEVSIELFSAFLNVLDSTGTWYDINGSAAGIALAGSTILSDSLTSGGNLFEYRVNTSSTCATAIETVDVILYEFASAGSNGSDTILCEQGNPENLYDLLSSQPDNYLGQWKQNGSPFGTDIFDPIMDTAGVYSYHITGLGACPDDSAQVQIDLAPSAGPLAYEDSIVVCGSDPVNLAALLHPNTLSGGYWTFGLNPAPADSLFIAASHPFGEYIYTVWGCQGVGTTTIDVILGTTANPVWTPPTTLCENADLLQLDSLISSSQLGGTWSGDGVTNGVFDPSTGFNDAVVTYTAGIGLCEASHVDTIQVENQIAANAGNDGIMCGLSFGLNALSTGTSGTWSSLSGNVTFVDQIDPLSSVSVSSAGVYDFIWTNNTGVCISSDTTRVEFFEPVDPTEVYAGEDTVLNISTSLQLNATPLYNGIGTWRFLEGSGYIVDAYDENTNVSDLKIGENTLLWEVSNGPCPMESDSLRITVNGLLVPTGFSPNGDLVNDNFEVTGIQAYPEAHLMVFDRWGLKVYEKSNYANEWDGRSDNGRDLPNDTYFIVLRFENDNIYNGHVIIKR